MADADHTSVQSDTTRRLVLPAIFALGVSCVMTQLALMREMLSAFAGNEMVLGIVLGLWLLLMGLGTALGRTADKLRSPLAVLIATQIFIAVIPLGQVFALRALRNEVFVRGAEVGVTGTVLSAAVLLLPYCILAGYALTLACSILNRCGDASGAGRVYVADSLGSIAGGVLFSFVLVRFLDHIALLAAPAALNLAAAAWVAVKRDAGVLPAETCQRAAGSTLLLAFSLTSLAAVVLFLFANPDSASTSLQFPGQNVLFRANSPYGRLVVTESGGQTNFIENGVAVVSTPNVERVEEAAHYAMSQRPGARRVLLVSGGVAGVAREILKYNVTGVDCVELDPVIVTAGQRFLPGNMADPRLHVVMTDGRRFIRQTTNRYEAVILALPDPSTAQLNRFFTVQFFGEVKRLLAHDGVLSFALGRYENYISPDLARLLASAHRSLKQSFSNVLVLPGGRVFFLASDGPLYDGIAARVEQQGVATKLVNRHYLDAMLTADRMADIQRAVSQPAALNRDFSPMLYYYHLRHWMSQFKVSFGVLQAVLLILLLVYLIRLRGPALVLFASGFAGSALAIVLLLAFQVLCGSVYYQLGIIVTVFMAGLAAGAAWANRLTESWSNGVLGHWSKPDLAPVPSLHPSITPTSKLLAFLAFVIAGLALVLPVLLPALNPLARGNVGDLAVQAVIGLLTLLLAVLVGAQFPLANRLAFDGTNRAASRLYTADFVGAFLGALLASTLLIPLLGVTGTCLVTALLNFAAGGVILSRRVTT